MSMLLLLLRVRASDVPRSSVRLPDISLVADADGSGTPSGHLRVPIHMDPDTTPRSRGSIHPCRLWGDPSRSVCCAPTEVKNIKVSTDIPPFFPFLNLSSPPPTLHTFCSGCFCSGVCQDDVLALGKIKSENQEGVPASFAPPLEMRGRRRDACSLAVFLGSGSCGSCTRLSLLA